jgi:hypothetical protein
MCDKCDSVTTHAKDGRCQPCRMAKHVAAGRTGVRYCTVCEIDTDHSKAGLCKKCIRAKSLCECGKILKQCKDHFPDDKKLKSKHWCVVCLDKLLSPPRIRDGIRACAECDSTVPKRIEIILRPKFEKLIGPAHMFDKMIGGEGCGADKTWTRPDMLWLTCDDDFANMRIVVIECDEQSHADEDASCHAARMSKQHEALQSAARQEYGAADVPVVFLRYNPDSYDLGRVSGEDRISAVSAEARRILFEGGWVDFAPHCPHVAYFYYHSKGRKHIDHMLAHPDSAIVYKQV